LRPPVSSANTGDNTGAASRATPTQDNSDAIFKVFLIPSSFLFLNEAKLSLDFSGLSIRVRRLEVVVRSL
jgi:hypothetical protein